MPIYEYRCESCGLELEKLQKISDPSLTDCPSCGKPALKKLVSASSFRLKGTGWYETDFKGKKKSTADAGQEAGPGNAANEGGDGGGRGKENAPSETAGKPAAAEAAGKGDTKSTGKDGK